MMQLPLRVFWFMNQCVDRIEAQKDVRSVAVSRASQCSASDAKEFRDQLVIEAGTIVKLETLSQEKLIAKAALEEKRDDEGFAELRMMAGQKIG